MALYAYTRFQIDWLLNAYRGFDLRMRRADMSSDKYNNGCNYKKTSVSIIFTNFSFVCPLIPVIHIKLWAKNFGQNNPLRISHEFDDDGQLLGICDHQSAASYESHPYIGYSDPKRVIF